MADIFPTLTIEEVFRLMVGEEGKDFDFFEDSGDVAIMKTKFWMERELS
jgi:hypothetical protein